MDFVLQSFGYIKKNFFKLLLLAVFPALLMLLTVDLSKIPQFLFSELNQSTLGEIYPYFSVLDADRILVSLLVVFLILLWMGIVISYIQRSIRLGRFRFSNPLERLDESLFSVLPMGIVLLILAELTGFLTALFIFLATGVAQGAALTVIAVLVTAAMYLLYFSLFSMFVFAVPCMMEVGYSMSAAISQTLKQVQKHVMRLTPVLFFIYFICAFACYAVLTASGWHLLLYALIYIFGFMFLCTFIVTGYNKINK